jgi:hypothetical protein
VQVHQLSRAKRHLHATEVGIAFRTPYGDRTSEPGKSFWLVHFHPAFAFSMPLWTNSEVIGERSASYSCSEEGVLHHFSSPSTPSASLRIQSFILSGCYDRVPRASSMETL